MCPGTFHENEIFGGGYMAKNSDENIAILREVAATVYWVWRYLHTHWWSKAI